MTAVVSESSYITDDHCSTNFELPTYEDTQRLFKQLTSRDMASRVVALAALNEEVTALACLQMYGCQESYQTGLVKNNFYGQEQKRETRCREACFIADRDDKSIEKVDKYLHYILTSLLRLSKWCPFDDLRSGCKQALVKFADQGIQVPKVLVEEPSAFIPHEEIPPVDTDDEQTYSLYVESYMQTCRLEHMVLIMGMHPQYLKEFLSVNMYLLKNDGALPYCYRSYIGILAAARHKCSYLVHLMESDFLMCGGDPDWLKGLKYACPKLQSLSFINKLLAHRPWLIKAGDIEKLCRGGPGWQWSHSELLQALVLLCHFHSLAIFCHGSGINLEIDHIKVTDIESQEKQKNGDKSSIHAYQSNTTPDSDSSSNDNDIDMLLQKMQKLHDEHDENVTREEMNRRFESQKNESASEILHPTGNDDPSSDIISQDDVKYSFKYIDDVDFNYQDFAKRNESSYIPTFRAMDFNWQDHAYSLVTSYYPPVGEMLDSKFNTAYNLTYNTLATKEHVDTTKLRRAIWMYIHCTCGIMYDDYNYGEVNQLMERSLKTFIKSVSCFPELTTKAIYDSFWKHFRHSEKVHVNIVLLEGRFQVELLYALRALTEYIK